MRKFLFYFFVFLLIFITSSICYAVEVNSPYAILIDGSSGRILFEKDAYAKTAPASTTKVMTAILVLENANLTDGAVVSKNAVNSVPSGGSIADLRAGEAFTIEDLLYALLLVSRK